MGKTVEKIKRVTALVSENTNPVPKGEDWDRARESLKWERKWCFIHIALGALLLFTLAFDALSGKNIVIDALNLMFNCGMAYLHFLKILDIKIKAYSDKVKALSDMFIDTYEAVVLKMAVFWPELPRPDEKSYSIAAKCAEKSVRLNLFRSRVLESIVFGDAVIVKPMV